MKSKTRPEDQFRRLLSTAEGSGRVEFKRSCLWPPEVDSLTVQKVLVRLANANPGEISLIELGREDDGKRLGLVDKELEPVTERQLAGAEQRLVQIADRLMPKMQIRWHSFVCLSDVAKVVIEVPGRAAGHWYQDEKGRRLAWIRLASDRRHSRHAESVGA